MPIFFGCTGNNTESTIDNVRFAKDNGADGAILAAPAYICAPEDDIERFFLDVADATDLPLGIYNNPPRVKSDLHWDNLLRIFKHPNYVVHKESTARVGQVAQVLAAKPDVSVMCCDSPNLGLVVPTMSLGGHGTANMTGNIAPAELADDLDAVDELRGGGEFQAAYLRTAAAAALHLFGDQSGGGEVADEGARHAGRRSAQAAHRPRRAKRSPRACASSPISASTRPTATSSSRSRPWRRELRPSRTRANSLAHAVSKNHGPRHPRAKRRWSVGASRGLGKACALGAGAARASMSPSWRASATCWNAPAPRSREATGVKVTTVAGDITTKDGRAAALAACPRPTSCSTTPTAGARRFPRLVAARTGSPRSTP